MPTAARPSLTSSRSRSCTAAESASPTSPPKSLRQVDLQPADRAGVRARDRRRLVLGEDDRLLRADAAARRAALLALVLVLDHDPFERIDAVDAEQAEVEALHAVRAAAVVDHRIPAPAGRSEQRFRRERGRCESARVCAGSIQRQAELHDRGVVRGLLAGLRLAPLAALRGDPANLRRRTPRACSSRAGRGSRCAGPGSRRSGRSPRACRPACRFSVFLVLVVAGGLSCVSPKWPLMPSRSRKPLQTASRIDVMD